LDATIIPLIETFEASMKTRRDSMLNAITSGEWESIPPVSQNPRQKIRELAAQQFKAARTYRKTADERQSGPLREERTDLKARKLLSSSLQPVLALHKGMKMRKSLEACRGDLNTGPISRQSKRFASQAVTAALKDALDEEFRNLGMGHIKTKLKDRNVRGKIMHQLLLDVPTSSKVEDILSEGEQRAIAIGSFLAELCLAKHSSAIVFDDPMSSLDHRRRGKVAKRLASESRQRQVIVFTHDIVFLNQLQKECNDIALSPGLRFLQKIAPCTGVVSEGLPWLHKSYKERIASLETEQRRFQKLPWPAEPHQALAMEMFQQYDLLRATIERVVQDFVLNGTVRRFEDYIRVSNLKLVVGLDESDVAEICRLYHRCHGIVSAHDSVSAKGDPPPTAEEFREDIQALKTVIQQIRDRR
jgi:ABC-type dipeptide/oligopeptide/nickel transport system ATPase subunit